MDGWIIGWMGGWMNAYDKDKMCIYDKQCI